MWEGKLMPSNMAAKQIFKIVENSKSDRKTSPINDFAVKSVIRINFDVLFVFVVLSVCNLIILEGVAHVTS